MGKSAQNRIDSVVIKNFKSIKTLTLSDCRPINVLIGRPNVGKSNILEALSLFDVPYMVNSSSKSLQDLVRIENIAHIFHNGDSTNQVEVSADPYSLFVNRSSNNGLALDIKHQDEASKFTFSSSLTLTTKKEPSILPDILTYYFPKHFIADSSNVDFLLPPSGNNLMETVASIPSLKSNLATLFHGYGLKMMFDSGSRQIKAMRENGLDMFLVPFSSLADSLQRLIFYKAAIQSNHGKTICLEEPEAHTFPPYISNFVNDIISDESNQYFITTHSPYVVNSLLESAGKRLAIYIVDLKDHATIVHRLNDENLQKVYDNGIDLFYNLEAFIEV